MMAVGPWECGPNTATCDARQLEQLDAGIVLA